MKKDAHDYLTTELDFFQKAYEVQFTHFMGVFYFWTTVVTAPVIAGLLTTNSKSNDPVVLPIILGLVAFMGLFLATKMFDIRCSQLRYITMMNRVRATLYRDIKDDLPNSFKRPFLPTNDLRKTAMRDFGMMMAITMSVLDAIFFGFAFPPLFQASTGSSWIAFSIYLLIGIAAYPILIYRKVPEPTDEP